MNAYVVKAYLRLNWLFERHMSCEAARGMTEAAFIRADIEHSGGKARPLDDRDEGRIVREINKLVLAAEKTPAAWDELKQKARMVYIQNQPR